MQFRGRLERTKQNQVEMNEVLKIDSVSYIKAPSCGESGRKHISEEAAHVDQLLPRRHLLPMPC